MKKVILIALCLFGIISARVFAQETPPAPTPTYQKQKPARKNFISNGFYFQLGPVFPQGDYASGQDIRNLVADTALKGKDTLVDVKYKGAKMGAALDLGFLIYIGPSFAGKHVRLGIDATFLSLWFNSIKSDGSSGGTDKYYLYAGQKFGPVISINPVDRLIIDISYKINANFSFHDEWGDGILKKYHSTYGANLLQNEFSLSVRYLIMKFAVQYNYGKMTYNNFNNSRPSQTIQANNLRIMIGLIF
ncbi:MAG: hypothetical protein WCK34_16615 [Bacteroidota bacterium]